jgi:hypothetical protein
MTAARLPGAQPPYASPSAHTEEPPGIGAAEGVAPPRDLAGAAGRWTRGAGAGLGGGGAADGFAPAVPSTSWAGPGTTGNAAEPWSGRGPADAPGAGAGAGGDTLAQPVAAQAVSRSKAREDRRTRATVSQCGAVGYSLNE